MIDDSNTHDPIREKWNRIYDQSDSAQQPGTPSLVLTENTMWLPPGGRALDIACGQGNNAQFLAENGLQVDAWDISDVAINKLKNLAEQTGLPIRARQLDIHPEALTPDYWQVVVICHYLDRSLMPAVRAAIAPGGLLFMQTFTANKQVNLGPSNPEFLLATDELLSMTQGMEVLAYRDEGNNDNVNVPLAGRAYVVARA